MNRRALAKGVAWAAPAVMVAAAAPSLAASPTAPKVTGSAWKCPGASDVPGGWPRHGYRVALSITPKPDVVVPVEVTLGNGRHATILGDATHTGAGWEFVVDAASSPSTLTVHAVVDGHPTTVTVKAHPRCSGASR